MYGAYCSGAEWRRRESFFGNAETFLFNIARGEPLTTYKWTGRNEYFMHADHKGIGIGGSSGGGGFGLYVTDNWEYGKQTACDTFANQAGS